MGRKVGDLPEQARLQEEHVPKVVDAKVGVTAEGRHEDAGWTWEAVAHTGRRIDHAAVERKQQQILETGRQVPAVLRFIEDAVTGDRAVVFEPFGEDTDRGDVLVLNAGPVVPEVAERFNNRWIGLALTREDLGWQAVG